MFILINVLTSLVSSFPALVLKTKELEGNSWWIHAPAMFLFLFFFCLQNILITHNHSEYCLSLLMFENPSYRHHIVGEKVLVNTVDAILSFSELSYIWYINLEKWLSLLMFLKSQFSTFTTLFLKMKKPDGNYWWVQCLLSCSKKCLILRISNGIMFILANVSKSILTSFVALVLKTTKYRENCADYSVYRFIVCKTFLYLIYKLE